MTDIEVEINDWKDDVRYEALVKEILRLRQTSYRQSQRIEKLRKGLYFLVFFSVSLFTILVLKGFISMPGSREKEISQALETRLKTDSLILAAKNYQNPVGDTIYLMGKPGSFTPGKIVYSVQIGAFVGVDVNRFSQNLTENIRQETVNDINQISLGLFSEPEPASIFLKLVQQMGFKDAFIIATKDGKRVPYSNPGTPIASPVKTTTPPPSSIVEKEDNKEDQTVPELTNNVPQTEATIQAESEQIELEEPERMEPQ